MSYQFTKDGGGEQSYDVIHGCDDREMVNMINYAKERKVELVAIMDAECDVVMITTKRVANLIIPVLNSERIQPLESLNYIEGSSTDLEKRFKE